MKKILALTISLIPTIWSLAAAQTTPTQFQQFMAWVGTQQANAGVSLSLERVKYATTWWDLFSIGQTGFNIGKAGALDFVDFGPAIAAANGTNSRYGVCVPIHAGNIWNSSTSHLSSSVATHVHITSLPDFSVSPLPLWPDGGRPLSKWNWRQDFQVAFAFRFGGS